MHPFDGRCVDHVATVAASWYHCEKLSGRSVISSLAGALDAACAFLFAAGVTIDLAHLVRLAYFHLLVRSNGSLYGVWCPHPSTSDSPCLRCRHCRCMLHPSSHIDELPSSEHRRHKPYGNSCRQSAQIAKASHKSWIQRHPYISQP